MNSSVKRLINVLSAIGYLTSIGFLVAGFVNIRHDDVFWWAYPVMVLMALGIPAFITAGLSYLIGIGFKPWHKN
ncbi:hypothetical protein AHAT_22970 [Agarivorans sp. Toyoura001]|uniref:hypothetical protein n=1 Tax=Agarivorans sp. Toyoura001 TaxID=2283141 RepID=UPI0010E09C17|nr:hypothetical protein [Agarivorans sp. Toyoura001]GDY26407.1 hypothetical protein AHAT_22970 [Agarivorans sp. Toyoura001]